MYSCCKTDTPNAYFIKSPICCTYMWTCTTRRGSKCSIIKLEYAQEASTYFQEPVLFHLMATLLSWQPTFTVEEDHPLIFFLPPLQPSFRAHGEHIEVLSRRYLQDFNWKENTTRNEVRSKLRQHMLGVISRYVQQLQKQTLSIYIVHKTEGRGGLANNDQSTCALLDLLS